MNLLPVQPDPSHRAGRASELVAAVSPPARARAAASSEERAGRSTAQPAIDQLQRERLMAHYVEAAGRQQAIAGQGLRARKAIDAYSNVSVVDQRESLAEMLGVSVYA